MTDTFENFAPHLDSFPYDGAEVTPSDTEDLAVYARLLYIGTSGNIKIKTMRGTVITLYNHPAGYMPVRVTRVYATGTTASNIVSLS